MEILFSLPTLIIVNTKTPQPSLTNLHTLNYVVFLYFCFLQEFSCFSLVDNVFRGLHVPLERSNSNMNRGIFKHGITKVHKIDTTTTIVYRLYFPKKKWQAAGLSRD